MSSDLGAWEPDEPPPGFAERVVNAARAGDARGARARTARAGDARGARARTARRIGVAAAGLSFAAVAAAAAVALWPRVPRGEAEATARQEIRIGPRARAVLEPGARIAWDGDVVTQARGDVFYRVAPGEAFHVRTGAGEVTVKGTCFRVKLKEESEMRGRDLKIAGTSAALGAAVLVGVYEGRVALSRPTGGSVDVAAGQSALADARGVRRGAGLDKAFADGAAAEEDPLLQANASLADTVRAYKGRLEAIEDEKKKLEKDLAEAQVKLAASADGAALALKTNEFDLSDDDWHRLAKEGVVKARFPCDRADSWSFSAKALDKMGLRPEDGKAIASAFAASQKRRWATVRPLCAQALGGAGDVADKVGESACIAIIQTMASQKDSAAADEGVRAAAEVRAGLRPMPGPEEPINPVERMMLALLGESKTIEADLTRSIGPDEARRVVFSEDEGCWHNNRWNVGPRADGADTPR